MSEGKGSISSADLMMKLVQAKKVMNKVDGGDYQKGHVNEQILRSNPEDVISSMQNTPTQSKNFDSAPTNRIQNSKLPDVIKKAMMESPIPQISLNDTLDMDFIKGAKRLMEQEGVATKPVPQSKPVNNNSNVDMGAIAVLIENTIRKVMDEKLNQILTASTTSSINENLVLKVGDSIFKGKITGVNKAK